MYSVYTLGETHINDLVPAGEPHQDSSERSQVQMGVALGFFSMAEDVFELINKLMTDVILHYWIGSGSRNTPLFR